MSGRAGEASSLVEIGEFMMTDQCLAGTHLPAIGLTVGAPLKDQIQLALDSQSEYNKWKQKKSDLDEAALHLRPKLESYLQSPPSCEELCPR